jgi:hypothetical protein
MDKTIFIKRTGGGEDDEVYFSKAELLDEEEYEIYDDEGDLDSKEQFAEYRFVRYVTLEESVSRVLRPDK